MAENVFLKAYIRSLETASLFIKKSADLNEQLIKKEITAEDYMNKAVGIWRESVSEFWYPKHDDKHH